VRRAPYAIQTAAHAHERAQRALRTTQTEFVAPVRRPTLARGIATRRLVNQGPGRATYGRIGEIRRERAQRMRLDPGRGVREHDDLPGRALHGRILAGGL